MRVDIYIAPIANEPGLIVYACPGCGSVDTMTTDEPVAFSKAKTARAKTARVRTARVKTARSVQ